MPCIDELREWHRRLLVTLASRNPLLYAIVSATPLYAVDWVDTAATDGIRVYVNCEWFRRLSDRGRLAALLHEALHILLQHPVRGSALPPEHHELANIAADAVVDVKLKELGLSNSLIDGVTIRDVEELLMAAGAEARDIESMSFEEIYELLLKALRRIAKAVARLCREKGCRDLLRPGACRDCIVIHVPLWLDDSVSDPREAARRMANEILSKSMHSEKKAGSGYAGIERLVREVAEPRLSLEKLVRYALSAAMGPRVKRTWSRPSRRGDTWPGKLLMGVKRILVAIDVSGSISDRELSEMIGAVIDAARSIRPQRVRVYTWDVRIEKIVEARSPAILAKNLRGTPGGGGTILSNALREIEKEARSTDYLIVMSDWELFDPEVAERLMARLSRKTCGILLIATPRHNKSILRRMARYAEATLILPGEDEYNGR